MGRVAWERHGDDVEPVVAIMLARRHSSAQRIRPSRGDGGIDILVPTARADYVDVYQVKRFATNLTAGQKRQIEESLARIQETVRDRGLSIAGWYLTLPLDPTPENLTWFAEITSSTDFPCEWRGLNFVEGLTSEFPDVIDYYLMDGRQRLDNVSKDLTALLRRRIEDSGDQPPPLQPRDMEEDLGSIYRALNAHDPHFKYSFRVDDSPPSTLGEPGMVFSVQAILPNLCVTHYVFARYDEAVLDRPVTIDLGLETPPGDDGEAELRDFQLYGTEFTGPASLEIDLPGGLGTQGSQEGRVWIGPADLTSEGYAIRMQVVGSEANELAVVMLDMDPVSVGPTRRGVRAHGTERSGAFKIDIRTDLDAQVVNLSFEPMDLTGKSPEAVIAAVDFMRVFHAPNLFRVAKPLGPITHEASPIPGDLGLDVSPTLDAIKHLATIQRRTTEQLLVPDLTRTLLREVKAWADAATLVERDELVRRWDHFQFRVPSGVSEQLRGAGETGFSLLFFEPFSVRIEDRDVELGLQRIVLETAVVDTVESPTEGDDELVKVVPGPSHDAHATLLDAADADSIRENGEDKRVRWRIPQPAQEPSSI